MKRNVRNVLIGLALLLIVGNAAASSLRGRGFTGNCVKSADVYLLDIERMNGTDLHTLELQKGDALRIRFETERGSMYMEIKAPDGTAVYRGNGRGATEFTVNISESGVYAVVVEGRRARGIVHIERTGGKQ